MQGLTLSRHAGRKRRTRLLQTITHALAIRSCLQKHGATVVAKALCTQLASQLGRKNKWCVLGEPGQSTASGPDSVWVQLTHGDPPSLPAPSAPILGLSATHTGLTDALTLPSTEPLEMCEIFRKDELFDIAHLHAGKREQRGRGGQAPCGPRSLKPFSFWESLELTMVGINFAQSVGKMNKTAQASKYIHVTPNIDWLGCLPTLFVLAINF